MLIAQAPRLATRQCMFECITNESMCKCFTSVCVCVRTGYIVLWCSNQTHPVSLIHFCCRHALYSSVQECLSHCPTYIHLNTHQAVLSPLLSLVWCVLTSLSLLVGSWTLAGICQCEHTNWRHLCPPAVSIPTASLSCESRQRYNQSTIHTCIRFHFHPHKS